MLDQLAARTPQSEPWAAEASFTSTSSNADVHRSRPSPVSPSRHRERFCAANVFRFRLEPKIPAYAGGVVGVAFWDLFHGQTGVAPNAIELRPILGFACLSG